MYKETIKKIIGFPFRLMGLKLVRRKSPRANDQRLFFLHLPKCGGVSVNRALSRAFGPHNLAALNSTAGRRAAEILGEPYKEYRAHLLWYYMSMKNVNVVTGHFSWCNKAYDAFCEDWMYVTLLREPVSRWFSHYFYNRYGGGDYCAIEKELPEFLDSERARRMGTMYTRRLSDVQTGGLSRKVNDAKSALNKFDLVGVTQEINEFRVSLSNKIGIKLSLPKKNTSPKKNKKKEAIERKGVRRKVEKMCKEDIEIFNHAKKLASR